MSSGTTRRAIGPPQNSAKLELAPLGRIRAANPQHRPPGHKTRGFGCGVYAQTPMCDRLEQIGPPRLLEATSEILDGRAAHRSRRLDSRWGEDNRGLRINATDLKRAIVPSG